MSDPRDMPLAIAALPRDARGDPVPWWVRCDANGVPDYHAPFPGRFNRAIAGQRCWTCGCRLGREVGFIIRAAEAIERASPWPPSHPDCALYTAAHCPHFGADDVVAVWVTRYYTPVVDAQRQFCRLGEPDRVHWFHRGEKASYEQARRALVEAAEKLTAEWDRASAVELARLLRIALQWLPPPQPSPLASPCGARDAAAEPARDSDPPAHSLQP